MFIKYCVFSLKCCDFLNSASSAAALVFYLPGMCTHTDTEGKQSQEYFKIFGKNTIFNEHPVAQVELLLCQIRAYLNLSHLLSYLAILRKPDRPRELPCHFIVYLTLPITPNLDIFYLASSSSQTMDLMLRAPG